MILYTERELEEQRLSEQRLRTQENDTIFALQGARDAIERAEWPTGSDRPAAQRAGTPVLASSLTCQQVGRRPERLSMGSLAIPADGASRESNER